jgi:hypothetical protein
MLIEVILVSSLILFLLDYSLINQRSIELFKQFKGAFRMPFIGTYYLVINSGMEG